MPDLRLFSRLMFICLTLLLVSCKAKTGETGESESDNPGSNPSETSAALPQTGSADSSANSVLKYKPPPDPAREQALWGAALNGDLDMVNILISQGVDVNATDKDGRTALMYAGYNGHEEVARKLIGAGAIADYRDNMGRTALLYASTGPFAGTVRLLLENNADPNIVDADEHFTPIMHAAAEGQMEVVKILLEYGADPSLKDVDGETARMFAVQNGHTEVANLLISK